MERDLGIHPRSGKPGAGEIPSRDITKSLSQRAASSGLCVTRIVVIPRSRCSSRSRSKTRGRGRGVEIARRLVGEQQSRVARERARDRDALLLASGERARAVVRRARRARRGRAARRRRRRASRSGTPAMRCGKRDVLLRRELGQQMVELEDEADVARCGTAPARAPASSSSDCPKTSTRPASGRSMPPSRWSSVDFPTPDGPITAAKRPLGTLEREPREHGHRRALAACRSSRGSRRGSRA